VGDGHDGFLSETADQKKVRSFERGVRFMNTNLLWHASQAARKELAQRCSIYKPHVHFCTDNAPSLDLVENTMAGEHGCGHGLG